MLSLPDFKEKQIIFAFLHQGEKISFKNSNLVIMDKAGKIKHQSTCYKLFLLIVVGTMTITTPIIRRANQHKFGIVFTSYSLKPYANFNFPLAGNVLLRRKQYSYARFEIAKKLITNKVDQQIKTLKQIRNKDDQLKEAIKKLSEYKKRLASGFLVNLQEILGIEGIASRVYFNHLFKKYNWQGRRPRTKQDPMNVLLDIGYSLLFYLLETMLHLYGFDVYQGVYHQEFYQRKSLVCDLVEPFRSIIDYQIYKSYQLDQIKIEDFHFSQKQYFLIGDKARPYVAILLGEILKYKKEIFLYVQDYYRSFIKNKDIKDYPFFDKYIINSN